MVKYVNKPKSPEEKQYLICIDYLDGDHSEWLIKTGRTESYKYIKDIDNRKRQGAWWYIKSMHS